MGKAYYTITPRDMEILAFAREVPYFDEDLVRKYFYAGKSGPEYVRKKLRYLELQGVLKGWRWVGLKKVYSISKPGERYLNMIAEGLKNVYFKPHMHLIFRPIETIKTEYIPHTLKLVDLLMHFISFRFFDQVFLFDNVLDKDSYTHFRPDIFITKAKHKIYFEYEATTKRPAHIFEKFTNYMQDKPALVLYLCKDNFLLDRIMRYMTEFRSSRSAFNLRFMDTQIRQSELFYFGAGEDPTYHNCIGKELTIERIIEKLS